mgnify:FL=1
MIVEVALNLPLQKTFDYAWPEGLDVDPVLGLRAVSYTHLTLPTSDLV